MFFDICITITNLVSLPKLILVIINLIAFLLKLVQVIHNVILTFLLQLVMTNISLFY